MGKKRFFKSIIIAILTICLQVGCNNIHDSGYCTGVACNDSITAKVLPTDNYLPGRYSVELLFSDNESIIAEFELIPANENDNESTDTSNLMVQVIENGSYSISWFMFNEFEDPLEINYTGLILSGDFAQDYEFTEEVIVNVKRDGSLLLSESISPDYNYYWCNYEYGECDLRQNKEADIEVIID